jgi:hypothetical protein
MTKSSDYPNGMDYDIEVSSAKPAPYFGNWSIDEKPDCEYTPQQYAVESEVKEGGKRQSVAFTIRK